MLKKIVSLLMVATILLTGVAYGAVFSDLQDGSYDWAKETINVLADEGIIKGYSDGTFAPAKQITRQEAFTLLARALGVNDYQNSFVVEFNQNEYSEVLKKFNTYAEKELCFMLSRGVLSEEDLQTYLSDENKEKVLLRHEAAVLLSKILNLRDEFDKNGEFEYNFTDVDKIPAESLAAVAFVASKGILTGMEDGSFSPDTGVTRAQIALIIDRVRKSLNIQYIVGTVSEVAAEEEAVVIDGQKYKLDKNAKYTINSKKAEFADILVGDMVTIVDIEDGMWALDAVRESELVIENAEGIVASHDANTITMTDGRKYRLSAFLTCWEKGELIDIAEMNFDNPVTLNIVNGFVRTVRGSGNVRSYQGAKVLSVSTLPAKKLRFEDSTGEVRELAVSSDAKITRNGYELKGLNELKIKDLAYITTEDSMITKIDSCIDFEDNACKVIQIVIDEKESSVVLDVLKNKERFRISDGMVFVGENDEEKTIYDLKLGDALKPIFEDGEITSFKYGKYVPPSSFSGKISGIDEEAKTVTITVDEEIKEIVLTDATMILKYQTAEKITIKDLKVGDNIVVAGEYIDDVFVPMSIVL